MSTVLPAASMTFDERYRAIDARDARFDGQFVTAVRSTGIYCRPSCPARTPKPANVTFYPTSAAAHEAGYRACKRCLPEAAPGSPEWNLRGDVAGRAMRLIADGVVEREGVPGLAARLGYSPRHLGRILTAELGAGPLALARAQRAHTARMLLVGTDLTASDVAFSAGFASVRQFNDTVQEVFGLTPGALRARRPAAGVGGQAPGAIDLVLPYREPLDLEGLFGWMTVRAVPGVEVATATSFARALRLPGGPVWFELRRDRAGRLRLRAHLTRLADLGTLVARARRLFDLDADPLAIDAALRVHPEVAPLVARVPGIRVPGAADPHEMLIRAMVGQQISVASARTALSRLTEALGEEVPEVEGTDRLFPTMDAIAEHGHEVLRGPGARIRAITAAAAALADGSLTLTSGDDGPAQRAALLARPGIGPWTADYVRMRVLGDPDITLPGDVAVRTGAARAGIPADPRGYDAWAARTAPWRSYLTAHLWRSLTPAPAEAPMPPAEDPAAPASAPAAPAEAPAPAAPAPARSGSIRRTRGAGVASDTTPVHYSPTDPTSGTQETT
ncbi:helix-turn-helix domain-containing protein [Microbacterium sp. W1N]|uniref:DNA-3-methyladenine glycosylase 2 family protein n=1 Tax=Microbacterium festucae TaxID=2977531 RepID=UPI0021BF26EF|nr:AlkA N-terminal domain-containing protein [Microbacterium festucae]MCT9818878.1 helix-turn-helix domain-containing protein [Microbacterium festucae]